MNDALREVPHAQHVAPDAVDAAPNTGWALVLAAEQLLVPGAERYSVAEAAAATSRRPEEVAALWRAMGLADPTSEEHPMRTADLDMIRSFPTPGPVPEAVLQQTRVFSAAMARIAEVFVDGLRDFYRLDISEDDVIAAVTRSFDIERVEQMLSYIFRRQLLAAITRRYAFHHPALGQEHLVAVGFADLVGYTGLGQRVDTAEMAAVAARLEWICHDIVAGAGGRVVKTMGDGVMFVSDDAVSAVAIALDMCDAVARSLDGSALRVGLSYGPAIARDGDYFGHDVNVASRISKLADPGRVVVSEALRRRLDGSTAPPSDGRTLMWNRKPEVGVRGVGTLDLWEVSRAVG